MEDEVEETGATKREDYETVDYMKEIYRRVMWVFNTLGLVLWVHCEKPVEPWLITYSMWANKRDSSQLEVSLFYRISDMLL